MKKIITLGVTVLAGLSLAACGNNKTNSTSTSTTSSKATHGKYYFDGTVANASDVKIKITDVKFYKGDESSNNKNLIAFEYEITNKSDKDINAIEGWQAIFNAYQDNKNTEGKLKVGPLPNNTSEQILHDQDQTIKKNGTVKCIAAYELDSNSKPVILKATKGYDGNVLGKKTFKIKEFQDQSESVNGSDSTSNAQGQSKGDSQQATQTSSATQTAESSNGSSTSDDGEVTIGGHKFHHEDFYGNDILVGNNNEGEAGEWAANDPSARNDSSVKAQLNSIYGN